MSLMIQRSAVQEPPAAGWTGHRSRRVDGHDPFFAYISNRSARTEVST